MKKIFILSIAAFAAFSIVSCKKENSFEMKAESKPVNVTIQINGTPLAKSTGNTYSAESKVNNLQILTFNETGALEVYKSVDDELSVNILATSGEKTIWAVVNYPYSLEGITSLNELNGTVTGLKDNGLDSFVMTGSLTTELTDGAIVAVTVKRLVARVSVAKITTAFEDPAYEDVEFTLKGLYMINVADTINFALSGAPQTWYNKLWHLDEEVDYLLYDALDEPLENGASYEAEHAFYPYPNNVDLSVKDIAVDQRGTWCPRQSIFVIEVEWNGEVGYYPIELPAIERNKTYIIEEVKITRSPSDVPYDPIETGEATVSITVADWELGLNLGTITI